MRNHQRNLLGELEDWRDEQPRVWRCEPGDVLVGELVRYTRGEGTYGPAWIAQVREEGSGELRSVWLFHMVLLYLFKTLRPQPGERLGIRRLDDGEGERGRYRRYAVVVDRDGGEGQVPDFDAFGPAGDAVVIPDTPNSGSTDNPTEPPCPFD